MPTSFVAVVLSLEYNAAVLYFELLSICRGYSKRILKCGLGRQGPSEMLQHSLTKFPAVDLETVTTAPTPVGKAEELKEPP